MKLEPADAVRRAQPGRAVVAWEARAEVAAAAAAVAAGGDVEQRARVPVRIRAVDDRVGIAGKRVDRGHERSRETCPADVQPAAQTDVLRRVVARGARPG